MDTLYEAADVFLNSFKLTLSSFESIIARDVLNIIEKIGSESSSYSKSDVTDDIISDKNDKDKDDNDDDEED